jgi:hypothetical protein
MGGPNPSRQQFKRRSWALLAGLLFACFLALPAGARDPVSVGLTSYQAVPLDNAVRLEWHTETEVSTVAYVVRRSTGSEQPVWLETLGSDGYIIAEGGPAEAANYAETDQSAINGVTYRYILFEIESDSSEFELAAVTVTAGIPTPTPTATPIVINVVPPPSPVGGPVAGSTASPAPGPTSTPGATAPAGSGSPATVAPGPTNPGTTPLPATPVPPRPTVEESQGGSPPPSPPAAETTSNGETTRGIAIAQAESEATATGPYPGPIVGQGEGEAGSYPTEPLVTAGPAVSTPYPAGTANLDEPAVSIIGSQSNPPQPDNVPQAAPESPATGRIILWVGFLLAGLVFIAGVVGSIALFTRKRE